MVTPKKPDKIVFFDGVCNLCNNSVKFILKRDTNRKLLFSSIQGDYFREHFSRNAKIQGIDSIIFYENGQLWSKSDAALRICLYLRRCWPLLYLLKIIPVFFRDKIYDYIAKNRYRWFGKRDACMVPDKNIQSRFL
jgi:predicted DCC family thiol-disulfide oxidoreductase YuxK